MVCDRRENRGNDWGTSKYKINDWGNGGWGGGVGDFWDLRSDFRDFLGPKAPCVFLMILMSKIIILNSLSTSKTIFVSPAAAR